MGNSRASAGACAHGGPIQEPGGGDGSAGGRLGQCYGGEREREVLHFAQLRVSWLSNPGTSSADGTVVSSSLASASPALGLPEAAGQMGWELVREPEPRAPLTVTVISCLEGSRGLQVAAQGPIATVAVVEAAVDIHRVLGVGGGWQ